MFSVETPKIKESNNDFEDKFNLKKYFCININKVVGVNEESTSEIKKSNLEIKNLFSKVGIFLLK